MKRLFVCLLTFSFFAGCKKSHEPAVFQGYFRMEVDGVLMDCPVTYAGRPSNDNYLEFRGSSGAGELDIVVPNAVPGEIVLNPTNFILGFSLYLNVANNQQETYFAGQNAGTGKLISRK